MTRKEINELAKEIFAITRDATFSFFLAAMLADLGYLKMPRSNEKENTHGKNEVS